VQHPLEQQGSGSDAYHQAECVDEKMLKPWFGNCLPHMYVVT